jgi:hypothetical protein
MNEIFEIFEIFDRRSVVYRNNKDFKILAIQQGRLRPNLKHSRKLSNYKIIRL